MDLRVWQWIYALTGKSASEAVGVGAVALCYVLQLESLITREGDTPIRPQLVDFGNVYQGVKLLVCKPLCDSCGLARDKHYRESLRRGESLRAVHLLVPSRATS